MKIWALGLTSEERNHLEVMGVDTLESAKDMFKALATARRVNSQKPVAEPCEICKVIAPKLGFPV